VEEGILCSRSTMAIVKVKFVVQKIEEALKFLVRSRNSRKSGPVIRLRKRSPLQTDLVISSTAWSTCE
jgi:hypothetical protein